MYIHSVIHKAKGCVLLPTGMFFIILVVTRVVKDPDEVTEDYMTLKKIASIYSCILLGRGVFHKGHR